MRTTLVLTGKFGDGMHEFVCRKDAHGEVRLYLRKSSKASGWLPEGNGMKIFRSIPIGRPPVANALEDQRWQRIRVQGTVREWFRYMTVTQEESQRIRDDWQRRFDSLPANGKMGTLPEHEQLKWEDLPRRAPRQCQAELEEYVASSTLENPPVNPVTGPGRPSHVVERELQSYQELLRARMRDSCGRAPVFQADFLFVQLPNKRIQLHRVSHGLFIDDATATDLSFSTLEYSPTPETANMGMDGDLVPTPNPEFDLAKKKRGNTITVRHHGIGRDVIKAYDVQVQAVSLPKRGDEPAQTVVRLTSLSKRRLAEIDPGYAYVPRPDDDDDGGNESDGARHGRRRGGGANRTGVRRQGVASARARVASTATANNRKGETNSP